MVFIETTGFARHITDYLSDEEQAALQGHLIEHPDEGDISPAPAAYGKFAGGRKGKESAAASGSFTTGVRREVKSTC